MKLDNISQYIEEVNKNSKFQLSLASRGGYITVSNTSGNSYDLGLDHIISFMKDVVNNLDQFKDYTSYDEKKWRTLTSQYITNSTAKSAIGTQTKAFYTSFSKIINWANKKDPSEYKDLNIDLEKISLENTISQLETLATFYSPIKSNNIAFKKEKLNVVLSSKDLNSFAYQTFKVLFDKYGFEKVTNGRTIKDSKINDIKYEGIKLNDSFGSNNIIGVFEEKQDKENLKSSGVLRYVDENLNLPEFPYSYFTTQWSDTNNDGLTFKSLENFIQGVTQNKFRATKHDDTYSLLEIINLASTVQQKIYYGAPGTGKSHKIENILKDIPEDQKERITFHPEYDYSCFVGGYKPSSDSTGTIQYKFVPQVFIKIYAEAWINDSKDYYLAIEEINRGNCAEIFGDLFQLLDRNSNYSISPAKELREYLEQELASAGQEGILNGKMKLPRNLHILASMNTSDQSLFPMDSAFKRRWSWEYVPINYESKNEDNSKNESFDYIVKIDDKSSFRWIHFIESVNSQIKLNRNLGSDKCIGNYFIKPDNAEISLEEFINKAMFYLWIDVFKDEEESIFSLIGNNISYEDFFPINSKGSENVIRLLSEYVLDVDIITSETETEKAKEEDSQ